MRKMCKRKYIKKPISKASLKRQYSLQVFTLWVLYHPTEPVSPKVIDYCNCFAEASFKFRPKDSPIFTTIRQA